MRILKAPPFENVGVSQTAIIPRLDLGETYHGIILTLGGTTFAKSDIDQIKIRLGGKVIFDVTGSHQDTMMKYLGQTANASYLLIPFSEFDARTIQGESIGAIDTSLGYSGFSIEVAIGSGASAPTLTAHTLTTPVKVITDPSHGPMIRAMIKTEHTPGGSGTFHLPLAIGSKAGALVKRMHLFHTNITQFDVKMNGIDLQDEGLNGIIQFWEDNLTRSTQSGHLCFDPLVRDNQSEAIPTTRQLPSGQVVQNNFDWKATLSGSDTITAYSEIYTTLDAV